jgi:tellurite resistance protein
MARTRKQAPRRGSQAVDRALITLLIGAMNANENVSAEEAARAHHIIWSMRRFRRRSGDAVNRLIWMMRERIEREGAQAAMEQASRDIPASLRPSAFAVAVDLVLADGVIERDERRFLTRLAGTLGIAPRLTREIVSVMLIKNAA